MEFKKKKYSGNSVIMKYEVTNISRIFSRGVIWSNAEIGRNNFILILMYL